MSAAQQAARCDSRRRTLSLDQLRTLTLRAFMWPAGSAMTRLLQLKRSSGTALAVRVSTTMWPMARPLRRPR
jgi:hypothetical protein